MSETTNSVTLPAQTGNPDAAYEAAKQHFTENDLVDLTLIISVMNAWNRIAISFRHGPAKRPL